MSSISNLPKVGILFESVSSASPLQIINSSRGLAQPIFLLRNIHFSDKKQFDILKKRFIVEDVNNRSLDEIAETCKSFNLCGLLTFSDSQVENVSVISEKNGYVSSSIGGGKNLNDKYIQRQALEGMDKSVRYCLFDDWIKNETLREKIGYPVIVKPCRGAGSKWTKLINSVEEARLFKQNVPSNLNLLIEEYLKGSSNYSNEFKIGDYISVEGAHSNQEYFPIGITGKFPISDNFSETGMFFPYRLNQKLESEIITQCKEASKRLGIVNGITHIEIKLTDDGPRIIEVNGRMGGYVYELVKKQTNIDLISTAFQIVINSKFDIPYSNIKTSKLVFQKFIIPKVDHRCIFKRVIFSLLDESFRLELIKQSGEIIDPLFGSYNNIGVIHGEATDIKDLVQINKYLQSFIEIEIEEKYE